METLNSTPNVMNFNTANPNTFRVPVVEGTFLGQIKFAVDDPSKRWVAKQQEDGSTTYSARVICTYTGEDNEDVKGKRVTGYISTKVDDNGHSQAIKLAWAIGAGERMIEEVSTHEDMCALLDDELFAEPVCKVQNVWIADEKQSDGTYKTLARRMKNFPLKDDGTYDFTIVSEFTGQKVPARNVINAFYEYKAQA